MSERTGSSQEIEFSLLALKISRNIPDRPSRTEVEPVLPRVPPSRASVAVLPPREIEFPEEEATVVQVRPAPRTPAPISRASREEAAAYLYNYQQNLLLSTKKQYRRGSYFSCGVLLLAILFYLSPSEWYLGTSQEIPVVEAEDAQAVSQEPLARLKAIALSWVGKDFNPGEYAQCAFFVRHVLEEAGINLPPTQEPWDGVAPTYPGTANSFAGSDIVQQVGDLDEGEIGLAFFENTYGNYPPRTITHVGFVIKTDGVLYLVDRPTRSGPVRQIPLSGHQYLARIPIAVALAPK